MAKPPPELTWQDKAILVVIPVVVLVIFIVSNYVTGDVDVTIAHGRKAAALEVRDLGQICALVPDVSTATQRCRVKARDGGLEYTFVFNVTGSHTLDLQIGRQLQFYGQYRYDEQGGVVEAPYRGKSKNWLGWVVYNNRRYMNESEGTPGN